MSGKNIRALAFTGLALFLASCTTPQQVATENNAAMNPMDTQNRDAIMAFYNKALTVNTETRPTQVLTPLVADGYKSSSSVDSKGADQLMGQLEFFWKLIPDLKWEPQEIVNEGDVYIVRSKATGSPNGDFMGMPTDGSKTFEIMTIDMHTMKDGKFVSTYHIEDWATAMRQLKPAAPPPAVDESAKTMEVANAFMGAMTSGDMETMVSLMHDDMVWQNEGDKTMPWIGPWNGKQTILEEFLPVFGANFKTIKWDPENAMSSGDTAAYFGKMVGEATKTKQQTPEFTFALRVKVKDGQVILWNWLEDSFAVSNAYHGR